MLGGKLVWCCKCKKEKKKPISVNHYLEKSKPLSHTTVWSRSRRHNNLVIQPDQRWAHNRLCINGRQDHSAISPTAVQASYQAACTDRAWSAIRSTSWMNKPRRWLPLLIWLGKQWINGGSLGVRLFGTGEHKKTQMQSVLWMMLFPLKGSH